MPPVRRSPAADFREAAAYLTRRAEAGAALPPEDARRFDPRTHEERAARDALYREIGEPYRMPIAITLTLPDEETPR